MNPLTTLIREQESAYHEKFGGISPIHAKSAIKSFHRQNIITLLEAECANLLAEKEMISTSAYATGWNGCLDQQIKHFKEVISELKK